MAVNHITIGINYKKNTNSKSRAYNKYYAQVDRRKTLTTDGLAQHIKEHDFGMGVDAIKAVLVKLSQCIPELLSQGIPVKLDGLGIFSATCSSEGCESGNLKENGSKLVKGIRIRFLPDGTDMMNLTSRQFMKQHCSLESRYVIEPVDGTNHFIPFESWEPSNP